MPVRGHLPIGGRTPLYTGISGSYKNKSSCSKILDPLCDHFCLGNHNSSAGVSGKPARLFWSTYGSESIASACFGRSHLSVCNSWIGIRWDLRHVKNIICILVWIGFVADNHRFDLFAASAWSGQRLGLGRPERAVYWLCLFYICLPGGAEGTPGR